MAYACPNTESKEWKMLVEQVGEELANMAFVRNGYEIPNVVPLSEIKKAIGFKNETENWANIAAKLIKYNKKHGTSHSFKPVRAYGNTWRLIFKPNYLPVNAEKQRQRLAAKNEYFRVEGEYKPATETLYTPSPSEQAAGFFTEDGDFLPNADRGLYDSTDELLAEAGGQIRSAEINRRKLFEKQIRSNREELAKATKEADIDKILKIQKELAYLQDKIDNPSSGAKRMITLSSKIAAFEQVLTLGNERIK